MPKKSKYEVLSEENNDAEFSGDDGRESKQSSAADETSDIRRGSRKRRHSATDLNDVSKKFCEDSEPPSDLCDDSTHHAEYIPHDSIGLLYGLHLSVLCLLRTYTYRDKYPSLTLAFGDFQIHRFSDIVLGYKKKSVHVQIENVDKYYGNNDINYTTLFAKQGRSSLNDNFNSFVRHLISKSDSSTSNVKYLIVYTNAGLELTEEKELKRTKSNNFYPFRFDKINIERCKILKDFLGTNDEVEGSGFYEFSREEGTREELLNRLELSLPVQKLMKEREIPQEFERRMKEAFLDKLVFAINQPSRERLKTIVKEEIERNREIRDNYTALEQQVLRALVAPKNPKRHDLSGMTYGLNLFISLLHTMFCHRNMLSVEVRGKSHAVSSNDFVINYRNRVTYVRNCFAKTPIGYNQLFPSKRQRNKNIPPINECFALFQELKTDVRYFIIHANVGLDLTKENELKRRRRDFYPLKFEGIDIEKKKYKIFRDCAFNGNGLYQFSRDEGTRRKLLSLLKLPRSSQEENEEEIKEKFLDKLIFAANQHKTVLNGAVKIEIMRGHESYEVPCNYEELNEGAIRCLESHRFSIITRDVMRKFLEDIKENTSSHQELRDRDIEKIKFVKATTQTKEGTRSFTRFLNYVTQGEGKKYFETMKINGINPPGVSSILGGAGVEATMAFKSLYDLWFDAAGNKTRYSEILGKEVNFTNVSAMLNHTGTNAASVYKELYDLWFDPAGNKTRYLKSFEEHKIPLRHVCSILRGARFHAVESFKNLYDLWFDREGNKTRYLETLEKEGIKLINMSSILGGAGRNSAKAFEDLFDLWFDARGNKTPYLKNLEEARINLSTITCILQVSGSRAAEAFRDLYDLWFDAEGNKTQYLKTLEEERISLRQISSMLNGVKCHAVKSFKELYNLWFDRKGSKTQYLRTLEKAGINLTNVSCILHRAGGSSARAFEKLYDLWFDAEGNKTQYLRNFEREKIHLTTISSILHGAGSRSSEAFKGLHDLWFDAEGNKSRYLETLEKEGINLSHVSNLVNGARANATKTFKELYYLWFDSRGNKTQILNTLEREGIKLPDICRILHGAGSNSVKAFRGLYDLWFDSEGNKTQYLESLEKEGVSLSSMSSILSGARSGACQAFIDLYTLWFNEHGNKTRYLEILDEECIALTVVTSILYGAGANAAGAFKDLHNSWFDENGNKRSYLAHFLEEKHGKRFTIANVTNILHSSGAGVKDAFEKLHNIFFDDDASATKLLRDFYNAGFEPMNLSSILYGKRANASSAIKKFHTLYFHGKNKKIKASGDLHSTAFRSEDQYTISCKAGNGEELFYYFCSAKKARSYFDRLSKDFTPGNLYKILQRDNTNIPRALKDFHRVCFYKTGKRKQPLEDFYSAGFTSRNLSRILYMTGNNASAIFKNFHQSCFGEGNHLRHFTAEKEVFTPKNISKILGKMGDDLCPVFEELHNRCFHESGKKRKYLKNLIKNRSSREIIGLLYEEVRRARASCLHDA